MKNLLDEWGCIYFLLLLLYLSLETTACNILQTNRFFKSQLLIKLNSDKKNRYKAKQQTKIEHKNRPLVRSFESTNKHNNVKIEL